MRDAVYIADIISEFTDSNLYWGVCVQGCQSPRDGTGFMDFGSGSDTKLYRTDYLSDCPHKIFGVSLCKMRCSSGGGLFVCPQCGISLQASCPSCGRTVQPEWNVCAHCGAALSQYREKNIVEPPGVGKTLWVALGIVAVLVLLLVFVLASNLVWYVIPQGINVMHHFI